MEGRSKACPLSSVYVSGLLAAQKRMERYREAAAPSHLRGSFLSFRFSEKDDKRKTGQKRPRMHLFELTRALVDIESTTNHEKNVTDYLFARLSELAGKSNGQIQRISAEPGRDNLFASWGEPVVTLSTHMEIGRAHV